MDDVNAVEQTLRELSELKELRERCAAQEQVQRDYLSQIKDLRSQLAAATTKAEKTAAARWKPERDALTEELDIYRALVKGWPKGRKLIKRLTRNDQGDYGDWDYDD